MSARKMKDSGNQWIGEIPEEWETRKIKFIANISTGNTPSKNNEEYYADFYSQQHGGDMKVHAADFGWSWGVDGTAKSALLGHG